MQEQGRGEPRPPEPPVQPPKRDRGTIVKVVIGLAVVILFIVFVAGNSDEVAVNLVFTTARIRLIWVFLGCALIGALVAYLLGRPGRRTSRRYIKELERRLGDTGERGRS